MCGVCVCGVCVCVWCVGVCVRESRDHKILENIGSDGNESACNAGDQSLILSQEDPLEKGMATHSSIPARRSPWTEEPGGQQSMGLLSCTQRKQLNTQSLLIL